MKDNFDFWKKTIQDVIKRELLAKASLSNMTEIDLNPLFVQTMNSETEQACLLLKSSFGFVTSNKDITEEQREALCDGYAITMLVGLKTGLSVFKFPPQ